MVNLIEIAELVMKVYDINSQIDADREEGWANVRYYSSLMTGCEFVVFENKEKNKVIVFKGTNDMNDIIHDLDFFPLKVKDNQHFCIHNGFHDQFESVKHHFIREINENTNAKIILTGHSLGGALATIASLFLFKKVCRNKNLEQVITFGSPRVLNEAFATFYNQHRSSITIQVKDSMDDITHLPPSFFYSDLEGCPITFTSSILKECGWFDRVKALIKPIKKFHHSMINYVESIKNYPFFEKLEFF